MRPPQETDRPTDEIVFIFLSYQQSGFGPRQQRHPASVDEKVPLERPAGELPEN